MDDLHRADEIAWSERESTIGDFLRGSRPAVLRGLAKDWPLVRAASISDEAAVAYVNRFYKGRPVNTIVAPPSERGQFFYRSDSKLMNFERSYPPLSEVLAALLEQRKAENPPGIAMQAILADECLPGLEKENPNPFVPKGAQARLWIGNKVTVAPHYDVADNLACVVAGRRRFILFPPEQTANLYPGPTDVTPANVPISMVSLDDPQLDRFPRYREALEAAVVAELEPGDAIYIPYLWWHGVQSLRPFNILMNYWSNREDMSARYPLHALLRLVYMAYHDMPPEHRRSWRALYDHYVFQTGGDPMEALASPHRDSEPKIDSASIARLKEMLRELLG